MNYSAGFVRKICPFSFFLILISAVLFWQSAPLAAISARAEKPAEPADYDIRADETNEARSAIENF